MAMQTEFQLKYDYFLYCIFSVTKSYSMKEVQGVVWLFHSENSEVIKVLFAHEQTLQGSVLLDFRGRLSDNFGGLVFKLSGFVSSSEIK